ncbi:MAG: hypothetical protein AAFO98_09795 [Pseudomonadota bacterium]
MSDASDNNAGDQQTVICLKWGDRYGPEYVNRLFHMVSRNTARPLRFVCLTDDRSGIEDGVEVLDMPEFNLPERMRFHPFRRMFLFDKAVPGLSGVVMHFDLDLLITNSIDPLFDEQPESPFITAENWTQPGQGIGNMSIFRYEIGTLTKVWDRFIKDPMAMMDKYRNSQTFVCRTIGKVDFFPPNWCLSFKHSLMPNWPFNFFSTPKLPKDAILVVFTGKPDIEEAARGEWPVEADWKKLYKHVRPTPWLLEHWR